ncbi:hypothetical protein BpHYR1_023181 [Brachionus plicatilis]|uniref:Uncharacterized protein n=1 Tax=Brachionus plicatilis TaxID=10195 RepID=A0A3M7PN42_BRAPC|nr:hypothetical protein BpHYR1_023181 [Brachionus plicatilis]
MSELLTDQTFVCPSYRFADLSFFCQRGIPRTIPNGFRLLLSPHSIEKNLLELIFTILLRIKTVEEKFIKKELNN